MDEKELCPECGTEVLTGTSCPKCGYDWTEPPNPRPLTPWERTIVFPTEREKQAFRVWAGGERST